MLNGIVVIDKPCDWTSHDVVAKLRGIFRQKRIGHGGTLDPMATGVLPIFVGRATRAAEFSENAEKEYVAGIKFGVVTDTQDITGNVLETCDVSVSAEQLSKVLPEFRGQIKQVPPMYSAVKIGGKKLYELARKGIETPRTSRDIVVSELEILSKNTENTGDDFILRVICSKGTYIRTLCHDIGTALGCGATLSSLRRTRAGVYNLDESYTLDDIISSVSNDNLSNLLLPVDSIFSKLPSITLSEKDSFKVKNGVRIKVSNHENGRYRVYAPTGDFLILGEICSGELRAVKSFFEV